MKPLRITYLVSLGILGVILAAILYSIPGESTKYKEVSRSELIKLEKGWVIQLDLNNSGESDEKVNISVKAGDTDSDMQSALIVPNSNFRYSYGAAPELGDTVSFKVYQDGGDQVPWVQEFHHHN